MDIAPVYWGIFNVLVLCVYVDAPPVPVVVTVSGRLVRLEALPLAGVPSALPVYRHVGQAMVPVVVIVPPVIGLGVAIDVTPGAAVLHGFPESIVLPFESNSTQ